MTIQSSVAIGKNMRLTLEMLNLKSALRRPLAPCGFGPLAALLILGVGFFASRPLAAQRPERPTLEITGYVIDAEIDTDHAPSRGQDDRHLYRA